MALTAQHWTISALAVELKKDKRTIAKIIDDSTIEPSKTRGKYNYYRLADIVAAMMDSDELDFQQEKAMESRERRRKLARENDIEERKVISFDEIVDILQNVSKQATSILEALPLNIKRRVPQLKAKDIEYVKLEIAKARNAVAEIKIK